MASRSLVISSAALLLAGAFFLHRTTPPAPRHSSPALSHRTPGPLQTEAVSKTIRVYAARPDGETLTSRRIIIGAADDLESVALLAAAHVVAGPPRRIRAIRFPAGTTVIGLRVEGSTVTVDLSKEVEQSAGGGFAEAGEFKALVWTLTDLPGLSDVRIRVNGKTIPTLPGGHFELDEPLSRSDW